MNKHSPDYESLQQLLSGDTEFDPGSMPVGVYYLHSRQKAVLDALLSIAVSPIATLPTVAGAVAIRAIDRENPLFRQERIGYMGKPFTINKLTTMPGVDKNLHSKGRHDDPRRSHLGRILSLLRVDESPQLINVARREMSVIGPRPLLSEYLKKARYILGNKAADEWIKTRSLALPGIFDDFANLHHSGVIGGSEFDEEESLRQRVAIESRYVLETASIQEDLRVLSGSIRLLGVAGCKHLLPLTKTH